MKANYRKYNDGTQNSSTYHNKDGTNVRAILKAQACKEVKQEGCGLEIKHFLLDK